MHNCCMAQAVASKTFGNVVLSALHHTHISSCLDTEIRALLTTQSHDSTQRVIKTLSGSGSKVIVRDDETGGDW